MLYSTACCFIEFAALIGSRFDFDRFGLLPRASPRQADLIILAGTLNMKMAQPTLRLYEQMPDPKYVIAMGACMITGGMFSMDSHQLKHVDAIHTGQYLQMPTRQAPSAAIKDAIGMPVPPALMTELDRDAERAQQNRRLQAKLESTTEPKVEGSAEES